MAHNFRKHIELGLTTGAGGNCCFVSKAGNDANDGLTPDTPKKSVNEAFTLRKPNVIIGAGVYANEEWWRGLAFQQQGQIFGDGQVLIAGRPELALIVQGGDFGMSITDCAIFNYGTVMQLGSPAGFRCRLTRCFIIGGFIGSTQERYSTEITAVDCIFKNVIMSPEYQNVTFLRTILLNTIAYCNRSFTYSYTDSALTLKTNDYDVRSDFNNLRGAVTVDGVTYANLAAQKAAVPAINANSISALPQFNRAEADDYTLKLASPHLNLSIGPSTHRLVNAFYFETTAGEGQDITVNNTLLRSTANPIYTVALIQVVNLVAGRAGQLLIKNNSLGNAEGYYLTDRIRISETPVEVNNFPVASGLNFNSDFAPDTANPSVYNNNVPDYTPYALGSAGRNPNRLTQQWRWSRQLLPDVSAGADWQTGSVFVEFENNRPPRYNPATNIGSGDPAYDIISPNEAPVAKWVQLKGKLRNDYAS
jgi:hypothetical protein